MIHLPGYASWKNRWFRWAAAEAELPKATPYGLRHTFVSMLIHEGRSPVEAANQAGHAPTMTLNTYAHVYDDLDPTARVPAEQRVLRARGELVPSQYPAVAPRPLLRLVTNEETPATAGVLQEPMCGFEPQTPSLRVPCRVRTCPDESHDSRGFA